MSIASARIWTMIMLATCVVFAGWYLLALFYERLPAEDRYEGDKPTPTEMSIAAWGAVLSFAAAAVFAFEAVV